MISNPFTGTAKLYAYAALGIAIVGLVGLVFVWDHGRIKAVKEGVRLAVEAECRTTIDTIQSEIHAANQREADLIEQR